MTMTLSLTQQEIDTIYQEQIIRIQYSSKKGLESILGGAK